MNSEQMALEAAKALYRKKATGIRIFDVRGVSGVTDFYIVATGTSAPHLKALIADIQRHMKELNIASYRSSGESSSGWVIVDYVTAVVHVFSPEARAYYDIERLWAKAKEIPFHPAN
jgi:ribosome-associated protein